MNIGIVLLLVVSFILSLWAAYSVGKLSVYLENIRKYEEERFECGMKIYNNHMNIFDLEYKLSQLEKEK